MRFTAATALAAGLLQATSAVAKMQSNAMDIGPEDPNAFADELHRRDDGTPTKGWGTFDQLIDHANPHLGTFKQRYWYGIQFWKGPGSPVYLVTPGEQSGEGFNRTWLSTQRLTGVMANHTGGAMVVLEHRYWGESSPFQELTVDNLQYLTLDNSLKDLTHFAKTFVPPFDKSGKSSADNAPWVYAGGSYSGALAGWLAALEPDTFWAYYSSSGVVQAVGDFWQYFAPVQEATPANCSADVNAVIDYVDLTLKFGSKKSKQALKDKFSLGDLQDEDFAAALEWGPWQWQSTQLYSLNTTGVNLYYEFCDYIENVSPNSTHKLPGAKGVGLTKALNGYAKYVKEVVIPDFCASAGYDEWKGASNTLCFQNLNASNVAYKDLAPDNWVNRQWNWMLCNEPFEWWQDGAPLGQRTLVSRYVNADYWRKQCPLHFPEGGYGLASGERARDVNKWTGGWNALNTTRAMHTNGQWDPWRDATLSSSFRPGGPVKSTEHLPVRIVEHGTHCSDLYAPNWDASEQAAAVAKDATQQMAGWVAEWYEEKGKAKPWE
ncbi:peptidase S28 [Chaetomium sp. MPI-SDFR-AT-0129]|nr:peptidase S28 [Chaetomium sp. MPI-SDFR-AT-0129]